MERFHDLITDELPKINWQSNFTDDCIKDPISGDKNCEQEDKSVESQSINKVTTEAELGFLFAYFTFLDDWSHEYQQATTPAFIQAARKDLAHAESIINALKNRPQYDDEDWLILITSDHGRNIFGNHGGDSLPEKLSFIAINKQVNDELFKPAVNEYMVQDLKQNFISSAAYELYQYKNLWSAGNQTDIAPTILSYLNISMQNNSFDGTSFLGRNSVRKLYASNFNYRNLLKTSKGLYRFIVDYFTKN